MVSVNQANNKNVSKFQYNFQHIVPVSKYRFRVFKNPKTQKIVATAFQETEIQYKIRIKEFSFGEDYAHVHMEVSIPNIISVPSAAQLLKEYFSYNVFKEMPQHKSDISKDISGVLDTIMEASVQEMKIYCKTTSEGRTYPTIYILWYKPRIPRASACEGCHLYANLISSVLPPGFEPGS